VNENLPSIIDAEMSVPFQTQWGCFFVSAFKVSCGIDTVECVSLQLGNLIDDEAGGIPVRIHSGCLTSEVFGHEGCDCAWQLQHALEVIKSSSKGVLIYLPSHEGRGNGLLQKIRSFRFTNEGLTTTQAFELMKVPVENREYGSAMAVLQRLGPKRIRLITNNPDKIKAAVDWGFEVVERIPTISEDPGLFGYLAAKKAELGHLI
jgi:GTP cyclohydrolase II